MLACIRWLAESGGGFVVASEGEVRARLPLPFAGLLPLDGAEQSATNLRRSIRPPRLGCGLASPFGTLSFLALPVIPEIRITDRGLFDVLAQQLILL